MSERSDEDDHVEEPEVPETETEPEPEHVRAVVDRVVEGVAVLLVGEEEVEHLLPGAELPPGAGPGAVLRVRRSGDGWEVVGRDAAAERARRERARHLIDRIRRRQRGSRFRPRH